MSLIFLSSSTVLCFVFFTTFVVCAYSKSIPRFPTSSRKHGVRSSSYTAGQDAGSSPNFLSGYKLIEGDILVEDPITSNNHVNLGGMRDQVQDSGINSQNSRWSNGIIPYVIGNNFGGWERDIIFGAMNEIMSSTCVRFQPAASWQTQYVSIQKHYGRVCNSVVGRSTYKIPQLMTLGEGCVNHATVLHELIHAIGFYHEHNRADRDNFVTILWNNIAKSNQHDFQKQLYSYDFGVGYDFDSVMHYGPTYFGFAGRQTIISKPPGRTFGHARHLSFRDKLKINRMYQCQ